MSITLQKQTARNLVLSPNQQAAYGGQIADANLTYRASVDASTSIEAMDKRYSDKDAVGHGTDFATFDLRTAWETSGTLKGQGGTELWMLGWMLAFAFGQETVTGAGPYTHLFTIPNITSLMPATTLYFEDTNDVHRYFPDMAVKSLSIDFPERGPIQGSADLVGTGRYSRASFSTALPTPFTAAQANYLLGSDSQVTCTPQTGVPVAFTGRQRGMSFKLDRGAAAFEASGDGLYAGSVQSGKLKFSFEITVMAEETDDVAGWYEGFTNMGISVATNPAKTYQLILNFPMARIKTRKLGNVEDKVAWQLTFDETSILQVGNAPALSATLINTCPGYLIPA